MRQRLSRVSAAYIQQLVSPLRKCDAALLHLTRALLVYQVCLYTHKRTHIHTYTEAAAAAVAFVLVLALVLALVAVGVVTIGNELPAAHRQKF